MSTDSTTIGNTHFLGRRYFHTFDALRFFAFLKVFLLHIPIVAYPWFNYIKAGGGIGVQFFFVLSGFLISYIILEEKQRTGKLNLKNFFVRRVLRIWPLYYLMVLVAYSTPYILTHFLHINSSGEGYEPELWVSLTFLENYKMMMTQQHANVSPLSVMWSLCIEEHFYIVWGVVLYYMHIRHVPKLITGSLIIAIVARVLFYRYSLAASDLFTNIDLFALGAIPAYLLIKKPEVIDRGIGRMSYWVKVLFVALILIVVTVCSQYAGNDKVFIIVTTVLGVLFSLLIVLTLPQKNPLRIKDRNVFSRMGVYTYGLYLYHILVINLLRQVFKGKGWDVDLPEYAILSILFVNVYILVV